MIIIRRKKINVEEAGRPLASVCLIKKKRKRKKPPTANRNNTCFIHLDGLPGESILTQSPASRVIWHVLHPATANVCQRDMQN